MSQLWRYRGALVLLAFVILPVCRADQFLRVNSAKTKVQLQGDALRITLAIDNTSGRRLPAQITLVLLDPKGQSHGEAQREENIAEGLSKSDWVIRFSGIKQADLDDLFWYRLRYRVEANASGEPSLAPIGGILSVSQVAPTMFRLEYAGPRAVRLGERFEALVRAIQPATFEPVPGVRLRATADVSDTDAVAPLKASGITDSQGYAKLEFLMPKTADSDSPSIDITGERDGYTAELDDEQITTFLFSTFRVNTDKALYQPGQTLHARVLLFGPNERAVANQGVEFRIYDPDDTLVFRGPATTSEFGIASAGWAIPSNERLGDYRVAVDAGEGDAEDDHGSTMVKISRYDLPTFTVSAKPDLKYYLPGQNAAVKVSAEYLFGKAVTRGHVRVIRDDEREWNYEKQTWDVHPGKVYEGETDSSGTFVANIDLGKDHKTLADDDYMRFQDITYTAYFTDPTSGRTEHRLFDLRLTKDRIHIYVMPARESVAKHTVDFYLSTYKADGTPASCAVTIRAASMRSPPLTEPGAVLRTIRTNSYGVAKVFDLPVPPEDASNDQLAVSFEARDKTGATGKHTEDFWFYGESGIRVETDKALYRPGDPIEVSLSSDDANATVDVGAESQWRFITSRIVHLHRGKASLSLAPSDRFVGPVTIYAYELGRRPKESFGDEYAEGSHTILFPHDTSLKLDVRMSKSTYRPGDEAEANIRVESAGGGGAESALGIVAVDKAVEERERSDADLQNPWQYVAFSTDWTNGFNLSGVSRADLDKVDLSKPLPTGFDLVAEMLLQGGGDVGQFDDSGSSPDLRKLFSSIIDPELAPVLTALRAQIDRDSDPQGESGIRKCLSTTSIGDLRDPWGTAYGVTIQPSGTDYRVSIMSAGPDQKMGTADDFEVASEGWPYFAPYATMIQKAADDYHTRTGGYIRDGKVLQSELLRRGVDFDSLRDPWQHAYRAVFGIEQNFYTIEVRSAGPDGKFSSASAPSADDVMESRTLFGYFDDIRKNMDAALQRYYHDQGVFPQNQQELAAAFEEAGIDWKSLRDPWGHEYYATFRTESEYSDAVVVQSYSEYAAGQHTAVDPVTASINYIDIRSSGPDGKKGTVDDFDAAMFSRAIYAQAKEEGGSANPSVVFSGELGAISGTITDPLGAVIANASVTATRYRTSEIYRANSDSEGHFLLRNLKPGEYEVRVVATGFRDDVFTQVPVRSSVVTQLNALLQLGAVSQTVTVTETRVSELQTQSASVVAVKKPDGTGKSPGTVTQIAPVSTPRLREYFPETLLWKPAVTTDKRGEAEIKFPLADSITTWDLKAIASTVDGRIGTAEKEVRAFQPFFTDEDLPQFLTAGDKIDLPVIVRNFLPHAEAVNVSLSAKPWVTMLGPNVQQSEVAANSSARLSFPIHAETPKNEGGLRVAAIGKTASDAIEKKTTVRPFGEEQVATDSRILNESAALNLSIPGTALPGSIDAELKVYPNLMAHVWEAIGAILERPWGCGEQTISSTYPSILLLQYAKRAGHEDSPETLKARNFAQLGYDRLLSYQTADGGFSYWGHGDAADLSLTAYAVMFLRDAKQVIPVDEQVIRKAQMWLLKQIQPNGHWPAKDYWHSQAEDPSRSAMVTAYVARVLASSEPATASDSEGQQLAKQTERDVTRALDWLKPRTHQEDEPYLIASYALALLETNNAENRKLGLDALERLKTLTHREGNANYWSLETNTPFYGWGRAGVVETTALALQAFERAPDAVRDANRALIDGGILYLLRNQDQYGIWYSTQATINVLSAMAELVASSSAAADGNVGSSASVVVDGNAVTKIALPSANELSAPVTVDLSKFLGPGDHHVEIKRTAGEPKASAQLAATYYIPWTQYSTSQTLLRQKGSAEALRLSVKYDKTTARVGEAVTCTVKAERVDFRGYGMMLAEIGLPPGAEVDRASLENAMKGSGWDVTQFDVQPDRVVVYLWPHAGGTTFSFSFTTRFGFDAETTPSVLYDYYNPDARAVVKPTHLTVR